MIKFYVYWAIDSYPGVTLRKPENPCDDLFGYEEIHVKTFEEFLNALDQESHNITDGGMMSLENAAQVIQEVAAIFYNCRNA
jgi:hypothetical protein